MAGQRQTSGDHRYASSPASVKTTLQILSFMCRIAKSLCLYGREPQSTNYIELRGTIFSRVSRTGGRSRYSDMHDTQGYPRQ